MSKIKMKKTVLYEDDCIEATNIKNKTVTLHIDSEEKTVTIFTNTTRGLAGAWTFDLDLLLEYLEREIN